MPNWMIDITKTVLDSAAISIGVAVVLKLISATAGIFTILWLGIQIYCAWTGTPFHQTPLVQRLKRKKE